MTAYINDLFEWKFPRVNPQGTEDFSTVKPVQANAEDALPLWGQHGQPPSL
jgi:hypothetical protein